VLVGPFLAGFGCANDIVTRLAQKYGQVDPEHLVEIKSHGGYAGWRAVISVWRMESRAYSKAA
jgi:hypothetical protein